MTGVLVLTKEERIARNTNRTWSPVMIRSYLGPLAAWMVLAAPGISCAAPLEGVAVRASRETPSQSFDGTVEAVRQAVIAAQVPGTVTRLDVRAGDRVQAGQVLVELDARAAEQTAGAIEALAAANGAGLEAASREFDRQQKLFAREYISRAALERAEAQYLARKAELEAGTAQAQAARTQAGHHRIVAPWAGIVAEVPATVGDMAMPGKPLLVLLEPGALRVSATLPQSALGRPLTRAAVSIELPGQSGPERLKPTRLTVLPTLDPVTHTATLRLDLPASASDSLRPGLFARVWISGAASAAASPERLFVPATTLVRRAELTAVYVLDDKNRPTLRQIRPGPAAGDDIEVLAGLAAGDRVARDPQAAAQVR
jgi:RND family efflux transporter MFP subunit